MEKLRKDDAKDNIKKYENQLVLDELSERTIKKVCCRCRAMA